MLTEYLRFCVIAMGLLLLNACAKHQDIEPEEDMAIAVDFGEVHRCSRISPEITIKDPPAGTRFYDVRLVEEGKTDRFLGGGIWNEDGSGIIPEGALTRHYTGPCPAANEVTTFVYVVSAMEAPGGQPLEVRLHRFKVE